MSREVRPTSHFDAVNQPNFKQRRFFNPQPDTQAQLPFRPSAVKYDRCGINASMSEFASNARSFYVRVRLTNCNLECLIDLGLESNLIHKNHAICLRIHKYGKYFV